MIGLLLGELGRVTSDGYPDNPFAQVWLCGGSREGALLGAS